MFHPCHPEHSNRRSLTLGEVQPLIPHPPESLQQPLGEVQIKSARRRRLCILSVSSYPVRCRPVTASTALVLISCCFVVAYPDQSGIKPVPLQWGAADGPARGPVVCSRLPSSIKLRNAIGAHSGSYSIYRSLAIAMGTDQELST